MSDVSPQPLYSTEALLVSDRRRSYLAAMMENSTKQKTNGQKVVRYLLLFLFLLLLISLGLPTWGSSRRTKVNSTEALVNAVATAIATYQVKTWTWDEGTSTKPIIRTYHIFDLNRDNQIDGYAAVIASPTQDGGFPKEMIVSGYTGFVTMAQPLINKNFINQQGIPIDAWGRPLHIAFDPIAFGASSFGVWSAGPDGIDGTSDDIRSWTPAPP